MEWHFSRHAFCTLASSFIRNYSESKFSFSPARGHKNGPTTRRLRGKFLSSSIQFACKKESAAALTVARTQDGCKSDAWWETFIMTASEWFCYWREINSGPRKLIPRKSVPTLSQPYDHIYSVLRWTGRMPCSFFFIWDTLVTNLSVLSKSTLIQTGVFPWYRSGWKKKGKKERKCLPRTRHHLHLLFEGKPDFGTCCFPSLELWANGHIFTHFSHHDAPHSTISQLMSHPPARPALMVITPGRFDVHRFILTKNPTSSQIQEHTEVTLMVTGDIRGCCHASVFLQ